MKSSFRLVQKGEKVIRGIVFPVYYLYLGERFVDKGNKIKVFFEDCSQSLLAVYFKSVVIDVLHPAIWKEAIKKGKLGSIYSLLKSMYQKEGLAEGEAPIRGVGPVKNYSIIFFKKDGEVEKRQRILFLSEINSPIPNAIPGEWKFNGFEAKKLGNGKIRVSWELKNNIWSSLSHVGTKVIN